MVYNGTMDANTTSKALSLVIQQLNTLCAIKAQHIDFLMGPVMNAARSAGERSVTANMIENNRAEILKLRDITDALRIIKEAQ